MFITYINQVILATSRQLDFLLFFTTIPLQSLQSSSNFDEWVVLQIFF